MPLCGNDVRRHGRQRREAVRANIWPVLPRGVTGFSSSTDTDAPATDRRTVLRIIHEAARAAGGHVTEAEGDPVLRSHWEVQIVRSAAEHVSVLVNRSHPIAAFARPGSFPPSFVDCPDIDLTMGDVLTVLSAADAERAPASGDLAALSEAEMHEVRYWKPEKLGWVIFNWWD